jgi:hypothetical protein
MIGDQEHQPRRPPLTGGPKREPLRWTTGALAVQNALDQFFRESSGEARIEEAV